jgi:oxygen-independent coproporphyrinogen-3 oxidase
MPGLYIHLPFCIKKCPYCDFASFDDIAYLADDYIEAVISELGAEAGKVKGPFETLFIGGGTPTMLNEKQLDRLFSAVYAICPRKNFREITVEANPETVTEKKAKILRANATRVSMGCQSFDDGELKKLCRIHDRKAIDRAFSILIGEGIGNINIDLIYGLEGQSAESAIYSVREAIKLNPAHISFYMMTLYGHTVFGEMSEKGELSLPEDAEIEKMYMEGCAALESSGYIQYEISNFSKKNMECLHNLNYWRQGEYLGVGSAAASYIDSIRKVNTLSPGAYIKKIRSGTGPVETSEEITPELLLKEHIMLRLRTVKGIDYALFKKVFNFDFEAKYSNIIENLSGQGLAAAGPGYFSLTRKGFLLSNEIIGNFF